MSIFNFFNKKNEKTNAAVEMLPVLEKEEPSVEMTDESKSDPDNNGKDKKTLTVSCLTGWPIDMIYGYLHKNYEEKGFNDAIVKSDLAFRDMNMNIIKKKILVTFKEVNLNYDVMTRDFESRIETCKAAGLLTTLLDLETQMSIIRTHKSELEQLERDFRNDADDTSVPLQSYNCGFIRGIATVTMTVSHKNLNMGQATSISPYTQQIASA